MKNDLQVQILRDIFKRNKNNSFLIDVLTHKEYTYGEIESLSLKLASYLVSQGLKKGDKVAIILPNCVEFVILYFACMHVGFIPIPISHRLNTHDAGYIFRHSEARVVFISTALIPVLYPLVEGNKEIKIFDFEPLRDHKENRIESKVKTSFDFFREIEKQKPYHAGPFQEIKDDDTAIIIYTSGTTGVSKGVMIMYGHIIKNGLVYANALGLKKGSRFYGTFSMSYLGGFWNAMLFPTLCEASIILDNAFDPSVAINFWKRVDKYEVNVLNIVPSICSILLAIDRSTESKTYAKNIRLALIGTAPLPQTLKKEFEKRYGITLYEQYALSETLFLSTNSPNLPYNKGAGRVLSGCNLTILDDDGKECKKNEAGDIVADTDYFMKGYYKNSKETKERIRNGKFYTGDVGYFDEDNYLFITDRKKDVIIRGGVKISPREIEEVIMKHPLVEEVAVIGMPHSVEGEEVVAVIKSVKEFDTEEIISQCRKYLASFKVPAHVIFIKEFPKTANGKVQKNKLKEILSKKI